jgi:hypothetical protein
MQKISLNTKFLTIQRIFEDKLPIISVRKVKIDGKLKKLMNLNQGEQQPGDFSYK